LHINLQVSASEEFSPHTSYKGFVPGPP